MDKCGLLSLYNECYVAGEAKAPELYTLGWTCCRERGEQGRGVGGEQITEAGKQRGAICRKLENMLASSP